MNKYNNINLSDERQDINRERKHDTSLFRYDIAEKLLPDACTGLKVLELGGGIAELTRRMLKKGMKITFIDLNEHNIAKAKEAGAETYEFDLNKGLAIFRDNSYDGVVILEVIEHIVAAEFLLTEISRVVRKGGFVILSTPNFNFFLNRFRILFGNLSIDEGYHYRFFNPKNLLNKLTEKGLDVIKTQNTMPAFGYNYLMNKLFQKPRKHLLVPFWLSGLFAHTLIFKAIKL